MRTGGSAPRQRAAGLRRAAAAVLVVTAALAPVTAAAHTRSMAYADWVLDDGGGTVRLRLTPLDHEALRVSLEREPGETPLDYLMANVRLRRGGVVCAPSDGRGIRLGAGRVGYEWRVTCGSQGVWRVESDALFEEVAGHVELVSVRLPGEGGLAERVLSESRRTADVGSSAPSSALEAASLFMREGVAHILSGWDHLVFLLVLLVSLAGTREVLLAVTGFTLGHSLTLIGTALGFASPDGPTVEALIALSIVVVAVENVWLAQGRSGRGLPAGLVGAMAVVAAVAPSAAAVSGLAVAGVALFASCHFGLLARSERPGRLRVGLAALFGLLHGFGFAGALAEMPLPPGHRVLALASFNVGVELGQLAVVGLVGTLLALGLARATRRRGVRELVTVLGSSAGAAVGAFWFVSRAFG